MCTNPLAGSDAGAGRCGARHASRTDTWCTHDTVQWGAHGFSVWNSRRKSASVYFSSGTAGYPRCWEQ